MVNLLCCTPPAEIAANEIFGQLQAAMAQHPKACLRTALVLVEGFDYVRPKGSDRLEVKPEWLVGRAKFVWDKCECFDKRWIDFRLSPEGEKSFAIAVHAHHHDKHLCGRIVANEIDQATARSAAHLRRRPNLLVVHFGDNPDDRSYRLEIFKHAARLGVQVLEKQMPAKPTADELLQEMQSLNHNPHVDAMLVQTIRDPELNQIIRRTLSVRKDPEFINISHLGQQFAAGPLAVPAAPSTAVSIRTLVHTALNGETEGKKALIINNSLVIGKPLAMMLSDDKMTVTLVNRYTGDYLYELARNADVVVTACGKHPILEPQHLKPGVVICDAAGDIDYDACLGVASKVTPAIGGVGPVTVATLLRATVMLALKYRKGSRVAKA